MAWPYCGSAANHYRIGQAYRSLANLRRNVTALRHSRDRLINELADVRALIDQKTEEVREANHRVKNSIQTAMSILNLQAEIHAGNDHRNPIYSTLTDAARRLSYIARAHEILYERGVGKQAMAMDVYLSDICAAFAAAHAQRPVELIATVEPIILDVRRAVGIALIAVEAVTNAYKHAFPDGRGGTIRVELRRADGRVRLSVTDDGVGFTAPEPDQSFGMRILHGFSRNLGAEAVIDGRAGTRVTATFPW